MALLSVSNLQLSFGDHTVLDGVNLTLQPGEKVGMVGRNGCGKSTLMKLIGGLSQHPADAGQIQLTRGAKAGYLTQDPDLDPERTLRDEAGSVFAELDALHQELEKLSHDMAEAEGDKLEQLLKQYEKVEHDMHAQGGYAVDHQVDATLHGLGLEDKTFSVKVKDLSGGQRGRLALAKLLLSNPDLLLLDEPTNHLDIAGRQWLEQFLADEFAGAVLVVSHDRWLLDRVVSRIYELDDGRLLEYPGNYKKYRELRAERKLVQQREYEKQQDKIRQERQFIDRYRAGQRARQAQGREKRLERFIDQQSYERPVEMDVMHLRLPPAARCSDQVLSAEHLSKSYEEGKKQLFDNLSLSVARGDRIGVIGPNGAGKSTLVRCMLSEQKPDNGHTRIGAQVDVGHFQQTHEGVDLSRTVVEHLKKFVPNESEQEARNVAGAFLFSGIEQDKELKVLSGGERSRAVLASLVAGKHNVLVLDEPTNHLDIPSAERLEDALKLYTEEPSGWGKEARGGGTMILITHDRMLLDNLVTQLVILDGHGGWTHFYGNYSQYMQAQQAAAKKKEQESSKPAKPKQSNNSKQKQPAKNNSSVSKNSAVSKMNVKAIETRIMEIEDEIGQIDSDLADPKVFRIPDKVKALQQRRQKLSDELSPLEDEWANRAGS